MPQHSRRPSPICAVKRDPATQRLRLVGFVPIPADDAHQAFLRRVTPPPWVTDLHDAAQETQKAGAS